MTTTPMNDDAWLDEILEKLVGEVHHELLGSQNNQRIPHYSTDEAASAIQAHIQEAVVAARIEELENIPGRRTRELKYIVDIADIMERIAELTNTLPKKKGA